jgi:hypothetical protein
MKINLHVKDLQLLRKIQAYFGGIGTIFIASDGKSASFEVRSLEDLSNVIIPHFLKYPLITQKRADFLLFKLVVELMSRKEHRTPEGIVKIISIRSSLNLGLTPTLNEAFPNITQPNRPLVEVPDVIDPD